MTNSKKEILTLLENGKINAEEAAQMLSGAGSAAPAEPASEKEPSSSSVEKEKAVANEPSMFHVRVRNLETGENKVSVNIPVRMLKYGLKLGGRFSPDLEGLNLGEINDMMTDIERGILVEVQNDESNEHVQVYLD